MTPDLVRRIVAGAGVTMILAGAAIGFFGERFGVPVETARLVGSVMVIAGVVDLLAAMMWVRLFGKNR